MKNDNKITISNGSITRRVTRETFLNKWSKLDFVVVPEKTETHNGDETALKIENESLKVENARLKADIERLEAKYDLLQTEFLEYKADIGNNFNEEMVNVEKEVIEAVEGVKLEATEIAEGSQIEDFISQEGEKLEVKKETGKAYTLESLNGLKKADLKVILDDLKVEYDPNDTNDELKDLIVNHSK